MPHPTKVYARLLWYAGRTKAQDVVPFSRETIAKLLDLTPSDVDRIKDGLLDALGENAEWNGIGLKIRYVAPDDVKIVFDHWRHVMDHPKARLTQDRRTKIKARLAEGYTVEDLKRAIDGCKASKYHMGGNDNGTVHDRIGLIFRNGEKVEQFQRYLKRRNRSIQDRIKEG